MSSASALIVNMHELPLESTGGGVLLRELLRHFASQRSVFALFPAYPHQAAKIEALCYELKAERVEALAMPVAADWGRASFTVRRLLAPNPGCVVAFQNPGSRRVCNELASRQPEATWLLVSPFAAAFLPPFMPAERVALYYTNVDEDIVTPVGPGFYRRFEAALERRRVRAYVKRSARRASRLAAITQTNADTLESVLRRPVSYVPPLMAPRPLKRDLVEPGLALITTNYTYAHNRVSMEWFLREVWPLTDAGLRLEVTGMDDGQGSLTRLLSITPRARYLGFLSKPDLEAAFSRCAVVVNPTISGSGFQIKMLDALARGIPLASTTQANPLAAEIDSSDEPQALAGLMKRLCQGTPKREFDYDCFHRKAVSCWMHFLRP